MPLPKPTPNQKQQEFIQSCMSSDVMRSEYPNEDQRFAVCKNIWKNRNKKQKASEITWNDKNVSVGPFLII